MQIKTKGKLSTEELNQLAEAGIRAKPYLAEGMGYGSSDAGMAKLSEDLESGAIGSEKAIELLMKGMSQFDGMMDKTANETVEGLKSQISDTFEVSILRKWGKGLQTGALAGMKTFSDFLSKNRDKLNALGDTLQDFGAKLSQKFADAAKSLTDTALKVTESTEFKNADLGGKIGIMWDKVIAEPFSAWWSTAAPGMGAKIGEGLGAGIGGVITGVLGLVTGGTDLSSGAGSSFATGFIKGFEPEKVGKAIMDAIKSVFTNSHFNPFSDNKNWLNTIILGGGILKAIPLIGGIVKGGTKAVRVVKSLSTGLSTLGIVKSMAVGAQGLAGTAAATAGTAATAATATTAATAAAGAATTAATTAAGAATAGATAAKVGASAIPMVAQAAGGVMGAVGLVSAATDLASSFDQNTKKEARDKRGSAAAKAGMVGGGAAAGAAIGSIIPVIGTLAGALVGAGIGGVGALMAGEDVGKSISDWYDGTKAIREMRDGLAEASQQAGEFAGKDKAVQALTEEYNRLNQKLVDGGTPMNERNIAQQKMRDIVAQLAQIYPGLITDMEKENGLLGDKAKLLSKMSENDRKRTEVALKNEIASASENFEKTKKNLMETNTDIKANEANVTQYEKANEQLIDYKAEWLSLDAKAAAEKEKGNKSYNDGAARAKLGEKIATAVENLGLKYSVRNPQGGVNGYTIDALMSPETNFWGKEKNGGELKIITEGNEKLAGVYGSLDESYKRGDELNAAGVQRFSSEKQLVELEYNNGTLEEQAQNYYQMSKEDQANFVKMLDEVKTLVSDQYKDFDLSGVIDLTLLNKAQQDSAQRKDESVKTFDAEKSRVEKDLGGSFAELAKNYETLDAKQKTAFDTAKAALLDYASQLDGLPTEVITKLKIEMGEIPSAPNFNVPMPGKAPITEWKLDLNDPGYSKPKAEGDIMTRPERVLVAEAGAEAIIPLTASRRRRGLNLWHKAGQMLGALDNTSLRGTQGAIPAYAKGGILTKPHVGLVAEAGAEAIIPLSPGKRKRGMDLWHKAGRMMGISSETPVPHANGGIFGDTLSTAGAVASPETYNNDSSTQTYTMGDNASGYTVSGSGSNIEVNVGGLNLSFTISNVQDEQGVINAIRNQISTISNELSMSIAKQLAQSFGNLSMAQC